MVKSPPAMQEIGDEGSIPGLEGLLEHKMATHSSILS